MTEISDLMARDPLFLTKEDRAEIIAYYRANREKFLQGNKAAGKAPKPAKTARPEGGLSLADLDL